MEFRYSDHSRSWIRACRSSLRGCRVWFLQCYCSAAGLRYPVEALAESVWDGGAPASAASLLRLYVSQIRRVLPAGRLRTHRAGYMLSLSNDGGGADPSQRHVRTFLMLELWQTEWCPASRRVRERLNELGVDYVTRQVPVEQEDRTALLATAGAHSIPALVVEDGSAVIGEAAPS
jgi:glutaredoxin